MVLIPVAPFGTGYGWYWSCLIQHYTGCLLGWPGSLFYSYARTKKWDLGVTVNGFLAGLVAITCPCYWVDPVGAFFIGIVATFVMIGCAELLEYLRIDDPIGAVPVHLASGIWGTLSLGLFATGAYGLPTPTGVDTSSVVTGLFYGGGLNQLGLPGAGFLLDGSGNPGCLLRPDVRAEICWCAACL